MARKYTKKSAKATYGKTFTKKSSSGKFKKGTKIQYKYENGRRVGARKAPSRR